jgi:hypothetical protein
LALAFPEVAAMDFKIVGEISQIKRSPSGRAFAKSRGREKYTGEDVGGSGRVSPASDLPMAPTTSPPYTLKNPAGRFCPSIGRFPEWRAPS